MSDTAGGEDRALLAFAACFDRAEISDPHWAATFASMGLTTTKKVEVAFDVEAHQSIAHVLHLCSSNTLDPQPHRLHQLLE